MAVAHAGLLGACSSDDGVNAFCQRLDATWDQGPIFPTRTDGEPVPDLEALERLQQLAAAAPEEIAEAFKVVAEHAEDLVQEAQIRTESGSSIAGSGRWSQSVVESSQSAVLQWADDSCDIDLRRATGPGTENGVGDPPPLLPND